MSHRLPLALIALIITISVGCKEPVGLPGNRVRTATVAVESCYVASDDTLLSGHVDWYKGLSKIWDRYSLIFGTITRGYYYYSSGQPNRAYPRQNGFCHFYVPDFTPKDGTVLACTLYYYQAAHNGNADLVVKWLPIIDWPIYDVDSLFWLIWSSTDVVATDTYHAGDNTWYKVPLNSAGCMDILACRGGGFVTGWVYPDSTNDTYADVSGVGANAPYIRVWYEEE